MKGDINDTLRSDGPDAVRARHDRAERYQRRKHNVTQSPKVRVNGANSHAEVEPLSFLDISDWDTKPVPPREWSVQDRVPLRQVSLFSGEGAMGKTLLELQRVVAHVTGQFWLGMEVAQGPAMYIGAEDEADEIQRRVVDIARHYGAKFFAMKGNLHLLSLAGEDAVLAAPNKNRVLQPTPLFWRIKEAACDIRPKLIVLDTSSDIYAGDENDRAQVRQFVGLVRGLAIASNSNVEICSHPSLTGINSKSGLSGSTGWHNSVRARSYLTVPEKGDALDPKLRRLEFKKNNYGPKAEDILLRWENGVYVLEPGAGSLEKRAADHRTEEVFLTLLSRFDRQGRTVSDKPNAPTFAPAMFSKEPAAEKTGKEAFHAAMRRLFAAGRIRVETYGRPSRPNSKIVAYN